jgi:hypothetical protein
MTNCHDACLHVASWGTARAELSAIAALRKNLPVWAPKDTPGHFLKHADEQTVLAVAALDNAVQAAGRPISDYRRWVIIAAPRFIGRIAGGATLNRYCRGGGPAISPHLIPQHSLHSISGALSILLATGQPNFGVGGTGNSLVEGLLAAVSFQNRGSEGAWLIATGWEPEPQLDEAGNCCNQPVCHAIALALHSAAQYGSCGRLRLLADQQSIGSSDAHRWDEEAAGLCRWLAADGEYHSFAWKLAFGGAIVCDVRKAGGSLRAAA